MKVSHILLAIVGVAIVGTLRLKAHVNNAIEGNNYKGPKAELVAIITDVTEVCYLESDKGYRSSYYDCSPQGESQMRKGLFIESVARTRPQVTYKFRFDTNSEMYEDTIYFLTERTEFIPRPGIEIPIMAGIEDPSYSHPDYKKLASES